jgi:acyl-CoA synthetase (AMP-forming)/AMP-acid ligase II
VTTPTTDQSGPGILHRIGDYLDYYARVAPRNTAIVFAGGRTSYAELKRRVDECAMAMLAAGVAKGARVAMLCTPGPEYWVVFLAATRIGALWVGLNPRFRLNEMRHVVLDAEPVLLFALDEFEGRRFGDDIAALRRSVPCIETVVMLAGPLGSPPAGHDIGFDAFLEMHRTCPPTRYREACASVKGSDPALIVYTSGTSGAPKGAVLSHFGIAAGAVLQTKHLRIGKPSMVVSFPINHVACVADCCATTCVKGGTIVFQERFEAGAVLAAVETERCTILGGVPTMLQMMLDHPKYATTDFSSVELVVWGGASMARETITELRKRFTRLMPVYGLTETSCNVVYGEDKASIEQLAQTIGRPTPEVGCRIVDEAGANCPPGAAGELQFKADFLMLGYWKNPEATAATVTADGWLKTGDIAEWRDDGTITLVGRSSDMYKSGGYNVYPREIELLLESLPGVAMAAVVGVPDELYQEVGCAFVVPDRRRQLDEQMLRTACSDRLANYKVPKTFAIVSELPLLSVGKVDKKALLRLKA